MGEAARLGHSWPSRSGGGEFAGVNYARDLPPTHPPPIKGEGYPLMHEARNYVAVTPADLYLRARS